MVATPLSLHKILHLYRFVGFSSRPISHTSQQILSPAKPAQISAFRGCSSCSLNSQTSNFGHGTVFKEVGISKNGFGQLGLDRLCVSAVADGGGTGGGFGGSGEGNSDGGSEGSSGGNSWSFLKWYLGLLVKYPVATKKVTAALLTLFGDRCENLGSVNTIISTIWGEIGLHWIDVGGALLLDSSCLYLATVVFLCVICRATVVFLFFDLPIVFFYTAIVCISFFAIFCCIIVALAYAVATRQGASEDDIGSLPMASLLGASENCEEQVVSGTGLETSNNNSTDELALQPEVSECCICLSQHVDGAELHALPCNHKFHSRCISRWLRIKATCPLCKYEVRRGYMLV